MFLIQSDVKAKQVFRVPLSKKVECSISFSKPITIEALEGLKEALLLMKKAWLRSEDPKPQPEYEI